MATQEPLERYFNGIPDIIGVDRISTTRTPTAAGHVNINGDDLTYWAGTTGEVRTVQYVGEPQASILVPQNLKSLDVVAASMPDFIRNTGGDLYWERTATGAETLYFSSLVPLKIETASRGAKLTGVKIAYEVTVADATSVDVTCTSTVYAQGVNPAVTAAHGGAVVDGDYDANHNTAAKRADKDVTVGEHLMTLTLNTPAFYITAGGEVRIEFIAVLANTGVLRLRSFHLIYTKAEN